MRRILRKIPAEFLNLPRARKKNNKKTKNIQTNQKGANMKEYEQTTSITNLIEQTMSNMKFLSDSSTIFGKPEIMPDGTTIIPVSKVTVGFIVGGGEYADLSTRRVATHYPMAGGSGGGVSMSPIGFIVNTNSQVKFVPTANLVVMDNILDKLTKVANFVKEKICKEKE